MRLVPPADPEALAVAIQEVCTSQAVRDALSETGHRAFGKRLSRQAIAEQVEADALVAIIEFVEQRHFLAARATPGCPEIDHHHLAAKIPEAECLAIACL